LLEDGSDDSTTLADRRRSTDDVPFIERLEDGPRRGRGEVVVVEDLEGGPEVNPKADEARRPDEDEAEEGVGAGPKSERDPDSSTVLGTGVVLALVRRGLNPALE